MYGQEQSKQKPSADALLVGALWAGFAVCDCPSFERKKDVSDCPIQQPAYHCYWSAKERSRQGCHLHDGAGVRLQHQRKRTDIDHIVSIHYKRELTRTQGTSKTKQAVRDYARTVTQLHKKQKPSVKKLSLSQCRQMLCL